MSVVERDLGRLKIMRELAILDTMVVTVGIQSDAGNGDDGTAIVEKAFFNEYGTESIPERSFIRATFDEHRTDLDRVIERLWDGVIRGKVTAAMAGQVIGDRHEGQIKKKMRSGSFAALSASTIAAKGSSKPLIDTGEMVNSIRYEVT